MRYQDRRVTILFVLTSTLIASVLFGLLPHASATGSHLDPRFAGDGKLLTDFSGLADSVADLAIQPDGKIIAAGSTYQMTGNHTSFALARYNANGTLDTTFSGDGKVTTDIGTTGGGSAVALQADGKILVAGYAASGGVDQFAVVRYTTAGVVDTTFSGGSALTQFTFGSDSTAFATDITVQPDGNIVVAGYVRGTINSQTVYDWAIARYSPSGTLDSTFSSDGKVNIDFNLNLVTAFEGASSVAFTGNKIVVGGTASPGGDSNFGLARLNTDGSLDTTFDGDGKVTTDFINGSNDRARGLAVQSDGKVVLAGSSETGNSVFALARYNTNGSLDTSFDGDGKLTTNLVGTSGEVVSGVAIQGDGKILAVGDLLVDPVLVRYNSNGSLDANFGQAGIVSTDLNNGSIDDLGTLALQTDGKIIAAGTSRVMAASNGDFALVRYLPNIDGKFDFDGDSKADISVYRPSTGVWYLLRSQAGLIGTGFGISTDKIAPADYDGDGKTDVAVFRPSTGTTYILNSSNGGFSSVVFGIAEDLPTPADYDGDGKADVSMFRPSNGTWYRLNSSSGVFVQFQFGASGDKPQVGDFDGDGRSDYAVYRPAAGAWYRIYSYDGSFHGDQFGASADLTVPADYDGDGRCDLAVFRPSTGAWYRLNSSDGAFVAIGFGASNDIPSPADFDRDGKADLTVFRPSDGNWYRLNSSTGAFVAQPFGANGDKPTPSAFRY
jgi:uncharacterized delta-60 repeat protein